MIIVISLASTRWGSFMWDAVIVRFVASPLLWSETPHLCGWCNNNSKFCPRHFHVCIWDTNNFKVHILLDKPIFLAPANRFMGRAFQSIGSGILYSFAPPPNSPILFVWGAFPSVLNLPLVNIKKKTSRCHHFRPLMFCPSQLHADMHEFSNDCSFLRLPK